MRLFLSRVLIGVILALVGYGIGQILDPKHTYNLPNVLALLLGVAGVILVRAISDFFTGSMRQIAQLVATQVLNEIRLPNVLKLNRRSKDKPAPKSSFINPLVLDTSAVIDGRILEVIQTGFLYGTIVVPNFILDEIHALSDSSEPLKRAKGKRGLEILEKIKKNKLVPVKIVTENPAESSTDAKLLKLSKNLRGKVVTTDFNLNKVARIKGVPVLNVNELAEVVKTPVVPGENLTVKIVQAGREKNQGVGYLPDGTMIVVEKGMPLVGKNVDTIVSRLIQTQAGKMIFTEIKEKR